MTTIILFKAGRVKPAVLCGKAEKTGGSRTAPSLRVPVTEANRDYLREIRRAELEAWREARGGTVCGKG